MKDRAVVAAYRSASGAARVVPAPLADRLVPMLGAVAAAMSGARRHQVERNLRRVAGRDLEPAELKRLTRATFASYVRYWLESFRLPGTPPEVLDAGVVIDGYARIQEGLDRGRGVILALPHLGGWEWAGFWLAAVRDVPVTVVVEPLDPPELFEWFARFRRSLGFGVVPLGPNAGSQVLSALKRGHVVCLLCDRDLGGDGVEVEFFGERTTLPAGPALLALRTGAPLLPAAVYHSGRGRRGLVLPALEATRELGLRKDVRRVTQALALELEGLIRRAPEQWHLLQPNWPSDRLSARDRD